MGNILSSISEDIQNNNKYKTHAFIYSSFIIHMNEFGKDSMLVLHFCIVMKPPHHILLPFLIFV